MCSTGVVDGLVSSQDLTPWYGVEAGSVKGNLADNDG